jgi:ATP-dependent Clp protease ATP-binding subunit ClpB
MRFDQMTIKLQEAFSSAQNLCVSAQQQSLECEHLLLSLFHDSDRIGSTLVKKVGVDYEQLLRKLEEQIAKYPKVEGDGQIYLSQTLNDIVSKAEEEARKRMKPLSHKSVLLH